MSKIVETVVCTEEVTVFDCVMRTVEVTVTKVGESVTTTTAVVVEVLMDSY